MIGNQQKLYELLYHAHVKSRYPYKMQETTVNDLGNAIEKKKWNKALNILQSRMMPEEKEKSIENTNDQTFHLLHVLFKKWAPLPLIEAFTRRYPSSICHKDGIQRLPLHIACDSNYEVDFQKAELLMKLHSASEQQPSGNLDHMKDLYHQTPLFETVKRRDPDAVKLVKALVTHFPAMASILDNQMRSPLHCYASGVDGSSLSIMRALLSTSPELASAQDIFGQTALHLLCAQPNVPREELIELLQVYPQAVTIEDAHQKTPLHYAWENFRRGLYHEETEFVSFETRDDEHTTFLQNLQLLCLAGTTGDLKMPPKWNLVSAFVQLSIYQPMQLFDYILSVRFDNDLQQCDEDGMLPLHYASISSRGWGGLRGESEFTVLENVLMNYPKATRNRNDAGDLPIHLSAKSASFYSWCMSNEVSSSHPCNTNLLLRADPETAKLRDGAGRLPLHLAIMSNKPWNNGISSLLKEFPTALTIPEPTTGLLPFMMASVGKEASLNTVFQLLIAFPCACASQNGTLDETLISPQHLFECRNSEAQRKSMKGIKRKLDECAML